MNLRRDSEDAERIGVFVPADEPSPAASTFSQDQIQNAPTRMTPSELEGPEVTGWEARLIKFFP